MKVRITQIDGKLPNLALMKLTHWHRVRGDLVTVTTDIRRGANEPDYDRVYGSAIFEKSQNRVLRFQAAWPNAILGGTGTPYATTVEDIIGERYSHLDYSDYQVLAKKAHTAAAAPSPFPLSMGFTQRGCRYALTTRCDDYCKVPAKEGAVAHENTIAEIWRGDPWPRHIYLLDNDFFGNPLWRERVREIVDGDFRVCLSQGINVRKLSDAAAQALATMKCRDTQFRRRRIYTAWDHAEDEDAVFRGLEKLVKVGIKPDHMMVYMLVGHQADESIEDCLYRLRRLRQFGARPYPMPKTRTMELVGFQRWAVGAYDKRISWERRVEARYQPKNLTPITSKIRRPAAQSFAGGLFA